jgi:hypothetical protein
VAGTLAREVEGDSMRVLLATDAMHDIDPAPLHAEEAAETTAAAVARLTGQHATANRQTDLRSELDWPNYPCTAASWGGIDLEGGGVAAARTTRKRPPARKKTAPRTPKTTPASPVAAVGPVPGVPRYEGPEAPVVLADARDRAADIVDLARDDAALLQDLAEAAAACTVTDTRARVTEMLSQAELGAEGLTAEAAREAAAQRETAEQHTLHARTEAERLLVGARDRADRLVAEARIQVTELTELTAHEQEATRSAVAELRRLAEADLTEIGTLVQERREEAGTILSRAQDQADALMTAAAREMEQARTRCADLAATAAAQYDARRAEAEQLYADATRSADERRREADGQVAGAHAEAEGARARLRTQLREMGEEFDAQSVAQRSALDKELADLKAARDQQRDQLRTEAKTVARELRESAEREAERLTKEASRKAEGITSRAQADEARARRMVEEAREAKRTSSRWHGWQQQLSHKAWKTAPWIALAAGVGLAASGEYKLACMVGIHPYVAPLLPVSIDVYCVTAFRAKRDIPAALALMASANVVFHLSEQAHLVPAGQAAPWWLTTFVVLIFVAVIWRVHSLMDHPSTDGHGGTDSTTGTDGRTGTPARTGGPAGTYTARTTPAGSDQYGTQARTSPARTVVTAARTEPVPGAPHIADPSRAVGDATSAYTDRTTGVQGPADGEPRTSTEHSGRTGTATFAHQGRPSTVTARTRTDDAVPAARTGTGGDRTRTSGTTSSGRTSTPLRVRTDAELLPSVQTLPREDDGFVNISRVRTQLSVNQTRAVRLLKEAGLLRPEDADKHLT